MISWCVVYTQPSKELVAQQHLREQGYETYLPRFKKIRRHARKIEEVLTPLFPRYIFVALDLVVARWRSINGTRGVSHLLMSEDVKPAQIPAGIIDALKSQEMSQGIVPVKSLISFLRGDKVRVLDGVFKDQEATFEALDDKGRIHLLLQCMGRDMRVFVPGHAVEGA